MDKPGGMSTGGNWLGMGIDQAQPGTECTVGTVCSFIPFTHIPTTHSLISFAHSLQATAHSIPHRSILSLRLITLAYALWLVVPSRLSQSFVHSCHYLSLPNGRSTTLLCRSLHSPKCPLGP